MSYCYLPSNSEKLLDELLNADNPSTYLHKKFINATPNEKEVLRGIIKELREEGFINVKWYDNCPGIVTLSNSARLYHERLAEHKQDNTHTVIYDQSIIIGDGNNIKNSIIANGKDKNPKKESFITKHPVVFAVLIGIATGLISGFILLFPFWKNIISWIEEVF